MFSSTVKVGRRLKLWKTKPISRKRRSLRALSESWARFRPPITTRPLSGVSRPARRLSNVLLPDPLGPMIERNSPPDTSRLTSVRAVKAVGPFP